MKLVQEETYHSGMITSLIRLKITQLIKLKTYNALQQVHKQ